YAHRQTQTNADHFDADATDATAQELRTQTAALHGCRYSVCEVHYGSTVDLLQLRAARFALRRTLAGWLPRLYIFAGFLCFAPQVFNFCREALIFGLFARQKAAGRPAFRGNTSWCELVQIAAFIFVVLEVGGLNVAFVEQRLEAVVGFAQADAELPGQLALRCARVCFQAAQERVAGFVVE